MFAHYMCCICFAFFSEQYESAISDLNKCLEIQKANLDPDNRLLAETYYQLGLAHCLNKQFEQSTESYKAAIKVLEDRIAKLSKVRWHVINSFSDYS